MKGKFNIHGALEKRLTHMPFTHALTGSNPVRVTIFQIKSERTSFFTYNTFSENLTLIFSLICVNPFIDDII
jgi:hypothetical protein